LSFHALNKIASASRVRNTGTRLCMPKKSSTLPTAIQPAAARSKIAAEPIRGAVACNANANIRNRTVAVATAIQKHRRMNQSRSANFSKLP
jgi:hypothetical protein